MNNTQFYITLALPFVTILIVWIGTTVANRGAIADLRSDMNNANQNLRTELRSAIDHLRAEITRRFDAFEAKLDRLDTEVRKDHEHRISVLEDRVFARVR